MTAPRTAFPEPIDELHGLPDGTVIDGELVVLDERGHRQFEELIASALMMQPSCIREAIHERPAAIFAFDVLMLDGCDQRKVLKPKTLLERVLCHGERVLHQLARDLRERRLENAFQAAPYG